MRLVDADALKKAITDATYNFEQIPIRVDKVQEIIDNAPTVDFEKLGESLRCQIRAEYGSCDDCELSCPRNELIKLLDLERPKGHWVNGYKSFNCSVCGKIAYSWNHFGEYIQVKSNFCPHCGAEMGKGKNNEDSN